MIQIVQIQISEEYKGLVPRMPDGEYQELKKDIEENGQDRPIVINQNGVILDGYHRYQICQELKRECNYDVKEFDNELDEKLYVLKSALLRRQLEAGQRATIALRMKPLMAEKAKQNESTTLSNSRVSRIRETVEEPLHTDKELAAEANVSTDTLYKTEQIWEHEDELPEEDIKAFEAGEKSVNAIYNEVVKIEDSKKEKTLKEWSKFLEEKTDLERFELFGKAEYQDNAPQVYNKWNFGKVDPRLGQEHPGQIPGQIAMNVLYFYTKQGDIVIDPFAGGGSTIDACHIMNRECHAYDIDPKRTDIKKSDVRNGLPKQIPKCNLVFLDPPYLFLKAKEYSEDSISSLPLDKFMEVINTVIKDAYNKLVKDGHIAIIIEGIMDENWEYFIDLPFQCVVSCLKVGFKQRQRISVPLSSQEKTPWMVNDAKEKKKLLTLNRDLIVFSKD